MPTKPVICCPTCNKKLDRRAVKLLALYMKAYPKGTIEEAIAEVYKLIK